MKKFIILLAFLICTSKIYPQTSEYKFIDPDAFERISNISLNILKTFKKYDNLIYKNNYKTLINVNSIALSNFYSVSTTAGTVVIHPMQADLLFHSRGLMLIASTVDLRIAKLFNEHLSNEYLIPYGWSNRYGIVGYKLLGRTKGNDLTLGLMWSSKPYIETDSEGNKLFGYLDKGGFVLKTTTISAVAPFLHVNILGNDIATIYSSEENALDSIEYEVSFNLGERAGKVNLGYSYSKFSDTNQAGFKINEYKLTNRTSLRMEYYHDLSINDIAYILPTFSFYFAKDNKPDKDSDILDTYTSLNVGYSYSKDIFEEAISGYLFKVTFENVYLYKNWFGSISLGVTYNYHNSLYRIPIRDENLLTAVLQFAK